MSGIARKREATTEDLLAFPDSGSPFDRGRGWPGSWWIVDEPELQPGRDVLVPDLAGRRRERPRRFRTRRSSPSRQRLEIP